MIEWDVLVVRYGEIGLKSGPVRSRFLKRLMENIRYSLKKEGIRDFRVSKIPGRVFVWTDEIEEALRAVSFVSGIVSFSRAKVFDADKRELIEKASNLGINWVSKEDSFAVETNRVGGHEYSSLEINEEVGERVQEVTGAEVDLDNPDEVIYLDIRKKKAFVFREKREGVMGLPVGVQGNVVSLFSGGIDSPVAASLLMKRGCFVSPIYVKKGRFSSEKEFDRVKEVAEKFNRYVPKNLELIVMDLESVFERINEFGGRLSCILCKRAMYRAAESFATKYSYEGVVTGESLGQVASQTLKNLKVLDESIDLPVFRPLIGFDKTETQKLSRKLGFLEATQKDIGECPILPNKVKTKTDLDEIKSIEKQNNLYKLVLEESKTYKEVPLG